MPMASSLSPSTSHSLCPPPPTFSPHSSLTLWLLSLFLSFLFSFSHISHARTHTHTHTLTYFHWITMRMILRNRKDTKSKTSLRKKQANKTVHNVVFFYSSLFRMWACIIYWYFINIVFLGAGKYFFKPTQMNNPLTDTLYSGSDMIADVITNSNIRLFSCVLIQNESLHIFPCTGGGCVGMPVCCGCLQWSTVCSAGQQVYADQVLWMWHERQEKLHLLPRLPGLLGQTLHRVLLLCRWVTLCET